MCVSLTDPPSKVGLGLGHKDRVVSVYSQSVRIPGGKYHRHTQQPVHYSSHGKRGVANQYLFTVHPDSQSHFISYSQNRLTYDSFYIIRRNWFHFLLFTPDALFTLSLVSEMRIP